MLLETDLLLCNPFLLAPFGMELAAINVVDMGMCNKSAVHNV